MKLGIDLHGVIDSNPELFKRALSTIALTGEVEIFIVSGPPKSEIITELDKLGFEEGLHYDEVYSVVDFLKESGVEMWQDGNGRWWTNDKDWCASKARICDKLHLYAMIDDKEMYKLDFKDIPTIFVLYGG
jgi:hypothetical protein